MPNPHNPATALALAELKAKISSRKRCIKRLIKCKSMSTSMLMELTHSLPTDKGICYPHLVHIDSASYFTLGIRQAVSCNPDEVMGMAKPPETVTGNCLMEAYLDGFITGLERVNEQLESQLGRQFGELPDDTKDTGQSPNQAEPAENRGETDRSNSDDGAEDPHVGKGGSATGAREGRLDLSTQANRPAPSGAAQPDAA